MAVLEHAAATVAASPSPSLSPLASPSASPVVHAATHAATTAVSNGWLDMLNAFLANVSQTDIIAAAAVAAVMLQSLVNRHKWLQSDLAWLQDLKRFVVAVALPWLGMLLAGFASGQNTMHLALPVFLAGQFLFYLVKAFKGLVLTAGSTPAADLAQTEGVG